MFPDNPDEKYLGCPKSAFFSTRNSRSVAQQPNHTWSTDLLTRTSAFTEQQTFYRSHISTLQLPNRKCDEPTLSRLTGTKRTLGLLNSWGHFKPLLGLTKPSK